MSFTTWVKSIFTKKDKKATDYVSRAKVSAPKVSPIPIKPKTVNRPVSSSPKKASHQSMLRTSSLSPTHLKEEHFFSDNGNRVDLVDVIAMSALFRQEEPAQSVSAQETVSDPEIETQRQDTCRASSVSYRVDVETNDVVEETTYTCNNDNSDFSSSSSDYSSSSSDSDSSSSSSSDD